MRKIAVFGDSAMSLESGEALHFAVGGKRMYAEAGDTLVVLGSSGAIRSFKDEVEIVCRTVQFIF